MRKLKQTVETKDGKTFESILTEHGVWSFGLERDILLHMESLRKHIVSCYDKLLCLPRKPRYVVKVNNNIVCSCDNEEVASIVSQCIYQMRGFFVDDFSEPSVNVETERN